MLIVVNCEENDPVDIRCGGPRILGFDFYVRNNMGDIIEDKIRTLLTKYNRPVIEIIKTDETNQSDETYDYWENESNLENCIKEGY